MGILLSQKFVQAGFKSCIILDVAGLQKKISLCAAHQRDKYFLLMVSYLFEGYYTVPLFRQSVLFWVTANLWSYHRTFLVPQECIFCDLKGGFCPIIFFLFLLILEKVYFSCFLSELILFDAGPSFHGISLVTEFQVFAKPSQSS